MRKTLRETDNFRLTVTEKPDKWGNYSWRLWAKDRNSTPSSVRLTRKDVAYLQNDCQQNPTFDAAAVWDFGVGAFVRAGTPALYAI